MTRTAALIRGELEAVRRRCAELEATWLDRTALPPEGLGDLYLLRDRLRAELSALEEEDGA